MAMKKCTLSGWLLRDLDTVIFIGLPVYEYPHCGIFLLSSWQYLYVLNPFP